MSIFGKIVDFYRDPEYFSNVRKIALPIIAQQAMFSLLEYAGRGFRGAKRRSVCCGSWTGGQIAFLLNLVHFGIISGAAMFTAQFWGGAMFQTCAGCLGCA